MQTDKLEKPSQIGILQEGRNLESTNVERDCRLQNANYFATPDEDMRQGDCSYCLSHLSTCHLEYDSGKTKIFANQANVTEIRTFKKRFRFANLSKDNALKSKIQNLYTYMI